MRTTKGTITIELYTNAAPQTVKNFLSYADEGLYNNTIFHHVVDGFAIMGGNYNKDFEIIPMKPAIISEWNAEINNKRGTIAMARFTGDPNSATNQFFINLMDNFHLDAPIDGAGYCVFGHVASGMETVDRISKVKFEAQNTHNVPLVPVVIKSVTRVLIEDPNILQSLLYYKTYQ